MISFLATTLSTVSRLGEPGALGNLIWRKTRGRFQPPAEVEKGGQGGHLPNCPLAPAALLQQIDIVLRHKAWRLRELTRVAKQGSSLGIQLVLGPRRRKLIVKMLITGQAANCRRMQPQSRSSTHLAIDHGCQHLALESAER